MDMSVIGAGHVGLVTGACFADLGHRVIMVDNDAKRIEQLKRGVMPYYEPGLEELVARGAREHRLTFTTSLKEGVQKSTIIFIAVGTPQKSNGEADLTYVEAVARSIAQHLSGYRLIVEKSTVPVQTGHRLAQTIKTYLKKKQQLFDVASNPEFLREGTAIQDFMKPDRVVVGVESQRAKQLLRSLYRPLGVPIVVTDIKSAELIKHASNSFLSMKISFINAVATLCERCGADVQQVAEGMGLDARIGRSFLNAGVGFGGFCFDGGESTFILNSPNLRVERFERLFDRSGTAETVKQVQVAVPAHGHILSFDAQHGRATVADLRCVTRRRYRGPMVDVQTMMGRRVRVTADHPMVTADAQTQDLRVTPACLIREGDFLVSPTELPAFKPARTLGLIPQLLQETPPLPIKVRAKDPQVFVHAYRRWGRHVPATICRYPHEMTRQGMVTWPVFRFLLEQKRFNPSVNGLRLFTNKGRATEIPARFSVDRRFMRWLGYYLAEGWISQEPGRGQAVHERIGVTFRRHEVEDLKDLHDILDRYGIRYQVVQFPNAVATVVSSRLLAWLFRDVLRCGVGSTEKQLPIIAFNVGPGHRKALLQGLFSGDGSVTALQGGRNAMFEYATVSKALADGVVLLLQSLGIVPSIHERRMIPPPVGSRRLATARGGRLPAAAPAGGGMKKSTCPAYIIRVSGVAQLRTLRGVFGRDRQRQIDRLLRGDQRQIAQRGFLRREGHVLFPVRRIRTTFHDGFVYSAETTNQLLVAGNGLVVHNCFPKDLEAFIKISEQLGYDFELLKAVRRINEAQKCSVLEKMQQALWVIKGKTIGVLGLAFKPNTDDMRYAPAIEIIEDLLREGATVKAFDPQAMSEAAHLLPKVKLCQDPYEVARHADALAVLTEWNEFKELDFARLKRLMRQPLIVDGRNLYDPRRLRSLGFRYIGIGRGKIEPH